MTGMVLRKLTGDMAKLHRMAQDGEIDEQSLADTLEGMKGDVEKKAEKILTVDRQLGVEAETLDAEIKRLQDMKKVRENRRKSLRDYLRVNMEVGGIEKISCPFFTITLRKPAKMAEITDEDALPSQYVETQVSTRPKKREILAALKQGEIVPGAALIDGASSVLIK